MKVKYDAEADILMFILRIVGRERSLGGARNRVSM